MVQRRGPVSNAIRNRSRIATTSLIVRRLRRARRESGVLPSLFSSANVQGAPRRLLTLAFLSALTSSLELTQSRPFLPAKIGWLGWVSAPRRNVFAGGSEMLVTRFRCKLKLPSSDETQRSIQQCRQPRALGAAVVRDCRKILAAHPGADRDNLRHTLILLELPPLKRLQRSLIRGRAPATFRT
jgi:hypothetical protein